MARRVDAVEVELLDGPGGPPGPQRSPDDDPRRRPRRWGVLVLVGVLLAGLGATVAEDADERRRAAELAALPGVAQPLDEVLAERWERAGWPLLDTGDLLVLEVGASLEAVRVATGEVVWSWQPADLPGSPDSCRATPGVGILRVPVAAEGPAVIACRSTELQRASGAGGVTSTEIALLDARTGEVAATVVETGVVVLTAEPSADGGVEVLFRDADRRFGVSRWDEDGRLVWRTVAPDRVMDDLEGSAFGWERVARGVITRGSSGAVAIDTTTGEVVDPDVLERDGRSGELEVAGGRLARWRWDPRGGTGELVDPGGAPVRDLPGPVLVAPTDDGSHPDVLVGLGVETRQTVWAVDGGSGADLWETPLSGSGGDLGPWTPLVRVGDVGVLAHATGLTALDLRDGGVLWRASGPPDGPVVPPVTDGTSVLTWAPRGGPPGEPGSARPHLVARDLRTGRERWSVPAPSDVRALLTLSSGTVLLLADGGLHALG